MDDEDVRVTNTLKLLDYCIDRSIAVDPQLAKDALTGKLTQADLGLPVLESTREDVVYGDVEIAERPL